MLKHLHTTEKNLYIDFFVNNELFIYKIKLEKKINFKYGKKYFRYRA